MSESKSPMPQKATNLKELDFPKAVVEVTKGSKIHRLEWGDKENYCILKDGILQLHKPEGTFHQWIISDGDLLGTDWIIIK